ncbi:MAG TPA: peptide chain release factor N(5)-glutamine methyltransferase [Candidatus Onthovicinus excrementipullorum]|nr:peptide chain release factor N(5)-glutamine methyltransferase [Candidatus Onthovicinus excrementipullorum]
MTVSQAIGQTARALRDGGIEDAEFEARELVSALCPFRHGHLGLHLPDLFNREAELRAYVDRRLRREPLQYILGEWEFMSLRFRVGEGVLIPRPETELLVEFAVQECGLRPWRIVDLCAGSGCVGISVAHMCPNAQVWLVEKSPQALAYLRQNIELNGTANAVPVPGDIFDQVLPEGPFDLILANPPYIPSAELATLQEEVRHEPSSALDGGEDGLDFYRGIAACYPAKIRPGGWLCVEFGDGQSEAVHALFAPYFSACEIVRDLTGLPRALFARR